ncbi:hypothetical protein HUO13_32490 [Saccharopolyspora erythraea]|uniref:hypothetical protein n=1 Tax=Saccharopolyspora erythraea TaxID=1836 RepID=UPI001BAAE7FD|nr:hypothetical protein [Saccharopolyspora erythraea]QUH04871.1 hypothetical protein HUO13_32490 [Saccharopolyspora erythraea]
MLLNPWDLPPEAVPCTVDLGSAGKGRRKTMTFYRIPAMSQGPEARRDRDGRCYLAYMYNFYLFRWYKGDGAASIHHGHLGCRNSTRLAWDLPINEPWDPAVLERRGRQWARDHDTMHRNRR